MPHHRHPVTAKNESLNIGEVKYGFRRMSFGAGGVISDSAEYAAKESSALFCRWLLCLAFLTHLLSPTLILSRDAVPQRIGGRLAIKPLLTSTCYLRSGHGCPEHSGPGMPDRTRSECGLLPLRSQ